MDRIKRLETAGDDVETPSRYLIAFGSGARCDQVVTIVDTVARRSHRRRLGEPADEFASRVLTEPGESWIPVGTDRPGTIDLKTATGAQLDDLEAVGTVLERENHP